MKRFLSSFRHALRGFVFAWKDQLNFKIQLAAACAVIGAGFYFSVTRLEWVILLFCIALVLCLEILNTAIENAVDLITNERNALAGKIKDMAASAVLFASIIAFVISWLIFVPYFI